jgi:membrane peptidoglycan carboxypeptidase
VASSAGDSTDDLFGRPASGSPSGEAAWPARRSVRAGAGTPGAATPGTPDGSADGVMAGATVRRPRPTGWRRFVNYPRSHVTTFRRWLPSWRVVVGAILGVIALGSGLVIAAYATTKVPTAAAYTKVQTSTVYYADGKTVVGNLRSTSSSDDADKNQNRKIVELADLPKYVGQAVVASEDRSFYKNSGVDPKGIARALYINLKSGSNAAGGSTITQQYAKNYFNQGGENYVAKFKQALLAIKLSKSQDKNEILQNYLNTIYWGRGAYGIETAAESYFGTTAAKLTPSQSALLAGIIPSPSNWDPGLGADSKKIATTRWERCLNLMADDGYITPAQRDAALKAGVPKTKTRTVSQSLSGQRGYIVDMVRAELKKSGMTDQDIDTRGMKIVTTIDKPMEDAAVAQIKTTPSDASKLLGTGLATVDPSTGAVKAIYGGKDWVKNQYNASASGFDGMKGATAQGGSTFKAFALAAALEEGYSLDQTFDGRGPQVIPGWSTTNKPLTNFEGEGFANETLRQGFYESVNTVFGNLNMDIGPDKTQAMAKLLGITGVDSNPANVLGTDSVSALEMASAYAVFASGGLATTPHVIVKATDSEGHTVYQGPTKQKRVIPVEVANGVVSAMQDVVTKGTAKTLPDTYQNPAQVMGRPIAGKTGSANDNVAAWFVGFTPQLATAVGNWQATKSGGNDTISRFGWYAQHSGWTMSGGTWPLALWTAYMKQVTDGMPVEQFPTYTPTMATWSPTPTMSSTPTQAPTPSTTPTQKPTPKETQEAPQPSTVPTGLVGQSVAAARSTLEGAGFRVVVTKQPSDQAPPDVVISVSPGEGSAVKPGQTVFVVVSSGPAPTKPTPTPTPTHTTVPSAPADPGDPGDGSGNGGGGNGGGGDQGGNGNSGGGGDSGDGNSDTSGK